MLVKFAAVQLSSVISTEEEFNKTENKLYSAANEPGNIQVRKIVRYNPDFVYARFKAIGSLEVDGPNANADGFPYGEFLDNRADYGYQSFIGKHAFVEHSSDNINNSIGDLYHAYLNRFNTGKFGNKDWQSLQDKERGWVLANRDVNEDGSIEVLMAVDKQLSPKVARMLETNAPVGCFVPGTPILMANGQYKDIEKVGVGDEVFTHTGISQKVVRTFERSITDDIYKVTILGISAPFYVTEEHPFEIYDSAKYQHDLSTGNKSTVFRKVMDLCVGDQVNTPSISLEDKNPSVSIEFARLLGYYAAEGSLRYYTPKNGKKYPASVTFSFSNLGEDKSFIDEVQDLIKLEFKTDSHRYVHKNGSCTDIVVNGPEIAQKFYKWGSSGAKTKKYHIDVLSWPREYQLSLIGAHINGDGHQQINLKNQSSSIQLATISKTLAEQVHFMLLRNGIVNTVYNYKLNNSKNLCYSVFVKSLYQNELVNYSKVQKNPFNSRKNSRIKMASSGAVSRPIVSIEKVPYRGSVHNFEVANDNSYVVNDIAVHNCSMGTNIDYSECTVCGNRAYVEEQYCSHIKFSKGQNVLVPASQINTLIKKGTLRIEWLPWILSRAEDIKAVKTASRKMVYAKAFETNYGLSFFELSVVANPAFTRGYKLEKIASLNKPSSQLMPVIRIAGNPVETIFKISDGYLEDILGHQDESQKLLLQRSGEVAKNALVTGNVHEVLIDKRNAPYFIQENIELIAAETPGFYKLSNPGALLDKTFAKTRHRSKIGIVGTVEEDFYACAVCHNVFNRKTQKKASIHDSTIFDTFAICPGCEKVGIQHKGDVYMATNKKAEYSTLPTTTEFTGDKEVIPGEGAFVGEKKDLYEGWAEKGSKLIEKEKAYRPMGTIFIDPIVAKNDLNVRSARIKELSKSAEILIARVKLALGDPATFLEEMGKEKEGPGMGMPKTPGIGGPESLERGSPSDSPLGSPMGMGGIAIEIDMTPDSAPEILDNTRADLELILDDLQRASELVGKRETEAAKALSQKIRWSRRFVNSAVKTAEAVDTLIADAESAVNDALMKLDRACEMLHGGTTEPEKEDEGMAKDKDKDNDNEKETKPFEKSEGKNPFAEKAKDDKQKSDKDSDNYKPTEGDDAMAKESKLELTAGNIGLLEKLRDTFARSGSLTQKVTAEGEDVKDEESDEESGEEKNASTVEKIEKGATLEKDATAQPPTGARDPGNYGDAGKIESHEMGRWWNDMYPEYVKMKSTEKGTELNIPDGKVELLTGFVGQKTPDNPEVGQSTNAPAIFAKRFLAAGPKWARSFIGVVKLAEDGTTEAFTSNFRDVAGESGGTEEFDEFSSENYLDKILATVKTRGMNAAYNEMRGKVAQLEGITPGKTQKVNPLYDTAEEKKDSNKPRPGERADAKEGHGKSAGDKEYYGKAFGDPGYASDLVTANQKIASLEEKVTEMNVEKRSSRMADYALHLARIAASRGICPFDLPSIQKQAMEYVKLDENSLQVVKGHLEKLDVVNQRALEAYQIPEAENMQKGVVHNTIDAVDKVRMQHTNPENVAPDGIQTAVEGDAKITADQQERIRKQANDVNTIVPQMHMDGAVNIGGMPDFTKHFNTIENQLKRKGVYEDNKHYLRSNRR